MSQRSWPLILLGVLAFFPVFGFFFGAAAVTWGLVSDRPKARLAIGLGAAGGLLQIALIIGSALFFRNGEFMREAQITQARADLPKLIAALDAAKAASGRYPTSLQMLVGYPVPTRFLNIYDPTVGVFRQVPYVYRLDSSTQSYDLFAVGPDGKADTEDDIRPDLPDSVRARSGYRPGR